MKQLILNLTFPLISSLTICPLAQAGEKIIEGAAAFKTNGNGLVQQAVFAVGIGQNEASADAQITNGTIKAFAAGTAGTIMFGQNDNIQSLSRDSSASLQTPQNEQVTQQVNINAINGTASGPGIRND